MAKSKIKFFKIYDNKVQTNSTDAEDLQVVRILQSGRDAGQFPQWFDVPSGAVIYITCGVISFESLVGQKYYLVWPFNHDAELTAHWDEYKNEAVVDYARNIKHVALYCGDGETLLKTFDISPAVNVKPYVKYFATNCPGSSNILACWNIPRLPTLGTNEPVAQKSTELFTTCVDIPGLPDLPDLV